MTVEFVCYNCRAIYRGFAEDPTHRGFDHNLAQKLVKQQQNDKKQTEKEFEGA